jgi:outer membrane immunogenic protein
MKKIIAISYLIIGLAYSSTAMAKSNFDGFYAGADLGYFAGADKGIEFQNGTVDGNNSETRNKGGFFGLFAGVNKVLDSNIVLGLEADYDKYYNNAKTTFLLNDDIIIGGLPLTTSLKNSSSLRAKAGYVFNQDSTLAYVTAGYATAMLKRTFYDRPSDVYSYNTRHNGWTAGLGVEHFVSSKVSLKGEYRYSNYGSARVTQVNPAYGSTFIDEQKYEDQSIRIGAAYHF